MKRTLFLAFLLSFNLAAKDDEQSKMSALDENIDNIAGIAQVIFLGDTDLDSVRGRIFELTPVTVGGPHNRINQRLAALITFANFASIRITSSRTFELQMDFAFGQNWVDVTTALANELRAHYDNLLRLSDAFCDRLINLNRQMSITRDNLRSFFPSAVQEELQFNSPRPLGYGLTGHYEQRFRESMQRNIGALQRVAANMSIAAFVSPEAQFGQGWLDELENTQREISRFTENIIRLREPNDFQNKFHFNPKMDYRGPPPGGCST